jgi:hypothetical protein
MARALQERVARKTIRDWHGLLRLWGRPAARPAHPAHRAPTPASPAETAIKALWESLTDTQRNEICFDWDYREKRRGLLRTFIANHWQVTRPCIRSDFFTRQQQFIIHDIFRELVNPEWYPRFLKQLKDDTFGHPWGADQSVALFGAPGSGKFQFLLCGRHLTLRADGGTEGRVAFGGPILYGHAPSGYDESVHHPGNIFWPQAEHANRLFRMLDGWQRQRALVDSLPPEQAVVFQGTNGSFPGLPVSEMAPDQRHELRKILLALVEPFREEDQRSVEDCLTLQGGLEKCSLAFYREGARFQAGTWDNWRLEGPAFVWYFRGTPHVHVWVHVANDPSVELNARNGAYLHPEHDPLGAYPKGSPPPDQLN